MTKLELLQAAKTKSDLASILNIPPRALTYRLYKIRPESQYHTFSIPKKTGGSRTIRAPEKELKNIQSALSNLLLDCLDEINKKRFPNSELASPKARHARTLKVKCNSARQKQPSISHGFERNRSIITNAMMHIGQKNVLNLDLANFFESFNFGRVRGYFLKNENFKLTPEVSTTIAQIACTDNSLPQGSPCSPVITNLITQSLDIRLAALANRHSCIYTRYADDITFSTRKKSFPSQIIRNSQGIQTLGKKLASEIRRSGFSVNPKKTRVLYHSSRQEVTGLVVNQKPSVKKDYWRLVRAQCHQLFTHGSYLEEVDDNFVTGSITELEGKLNFIDQIDHYNRLREKPPLDPRYHYKKDALAKSSSSKSREYLFNNREKTFSQFLFFKYFYANSTPTILTEGHTDNIYLKTALLQLSSNYPSLTKGSPPKLSCHLFNYTERTKFLLELAGGTDYLKSFVEKYNTRYEKYNAPTPTQPVIIVVDNDSGPSSLLHSLKKYDQAKLFPTNLKISDINDVKKSEFIWIFHNLYLVLTPLKGKNDTDIESLFKEKERLRKHNGKCFNTVEKRNEEKDLSKDSFARNIIRANRKSIDFSNFHGLLNRITAVQKHYEGIKNDNGSKDIQPFLATLLKPSQSPP
ncbi:retron Ec67 family RNA-directed DNA polymerase/endonuclease [Marinobacter daepoensis]|uniref:retron Ec67 family RNA-directed DNA polymerase/endonuclease n=1 Tax=Marinobacter daepoensis TaxID=262077 RepID=UPI001C94F428|nr:retron Ec67 family RNA-directed DNA polymerase/endonuclease [Marinobacter daepoensis]MBY6034002.1 retron Ec67 family RNA-directed DNA polymerase/endonuclease [Marinobacter daepoensis]